MQITALKSDYNISHDYTLLVKQGMVILIPSSSMRIIILHYRYHWGEKLDLVQRQTSFTVSSWKNPRNECCCGQCQVFDGTVIVQMLHPRTARTFQEYAGAVFTPYISSQGVLNKWTLSRMCTIALKSTNRQKGQVCQKKSSSNHSNPTELEGLPICG